ncbi:MAG: hypothetical protein KAS91_01795 [Candidatus Pacebacteria bacterium]|nr:hypothetical protein [Candidatus Paceibacterota bacterium]
MQEKDLIQKLQNLKQIKPNHDWVFWLKANILQTKPNNLYNRPRVKLAAFSFVSKYQKTLVPSLLAFFFVFSFVFAQTTLPGNVLYPIKTLTQNTKIYLASENTKPVVRLEIAKARMEDLSKVENYEKEISTIAKNIGRDLEIVPEEIKKINKKQIVLNVSKDIQEKSKDLKELADKISLEDKEREELNKSVENYQSQVLAYIIETTEEINQCPGYLQNKLAELEKYFTDTQEGLYQWSSNDIIQCKNLLLEASNAFKAGDCLTAMEKIESINKLLSIYSLDVQVETETPKM